MSQTLRAFRRHLTGPIRRYAQRWFEQRLRTVTGLVPITEFSGEDVFIVGYPKSGNSWFQHLVTGVIYGLDLVHTPDTLTQELIPDVRSKRYYKRFSTPMFFRSHRLPTPAYRRVVYLLRDGRDVMVSYFHHLRTLKGPEVDFLKMVQNGEGSMNARWHEHVEAWLSNPYSAEMIVIRYEDLLDDAVHELERFCAFVGVDRDVATLRRVAEKAAFEKMREREATLGWDHTSWPKDQFFVRRGQAGSYLDEMPPEVLEAFMGYARATLVKCEYL